MSDFNDWLRQLSRRKQGQLAAMLSAALVLGLLIMFALMAYFDRS